MPPDARVYILDDEADIGQIVSTQLSAAGYACRIFTRVPEFLEAVTEEAPLLIICDISMPGMDGLELRNTLMQRNLAGHAGFIFLTARADSQYRTRAWQAQADGYVTKPFTREELVAMANNVVAKIRSRTQQKPTADSIYLSEGTATRQVRIAEIIYATVVGDYTAVHTTRGSLRVQTTLTSLEADLPAHEFLRIHKSYLIATAQIESITRTKVYLRDKTEIPVGEKYRSNLDRLTAHRAQEG